jgi:anti-sigma factor RsiW
MHSDYTLLMSLVLDEEATPDEEARLRQHLPSCEECARTWQQWQVLEARLGTAPAVMAPHTLLEGVMTRLEQRREQRRRQELIASGLLLVWGGMITGLWLVTGILMWWGGTHPAEAGHVLSSGARALGSLMLLLSGVKVSLAACGGISLALGVVFLLGLAQASSMLWVWMMARFVSLRQVAAEATASQ